MDPELEQSQIALVPADILQQVLNKLPFTKLLSLRVVSKKVNDMICLLFFAPPHHIPKCVPVHFLNDWLTVYNSRTKAWKKHSLAFFQDHIRTHLEVVATAGGLICFQSGKADEHIVYNPISKLWRLLQIPRSVEDQTSDPPSLSVISSSGLYFSAGDRQRTLVLRKRTKISGLVVDCAAANHYKIVEASLQCNSAGSTVVYDSLTSSWTSGAKVPQGGEFSDGNAILCCGSLYYQAKPRHLTGSCTNMMCRMTSGAHSPLICQS